MDKIERIIIFLTLGLVIIGSILIDNNQWGYIKKLEVRIETLEMEAKTNKLLLKQTQRLVVPDARALKEKIK